MDTFAAATARSRGGRKRRRAACPSAVRVGLWCCVARTAWGWRVATPPAHPVRSPGGFRQAGLSEICAVHSRWMATRVHNDPDLSAPAISSLFGVEEGEEFDESDFEDEERDDDNEGDDLGQSADEYGYVDIAAEVAAWKVGEDTVDEAAPAPPTLAELKALGPPKPMRGRSLRKRALPVVAVVGRPNVGKSAIVNRVARAFREGGIVHDEPGVTRDRTYRRATWGEHDFEVVDTGGLVFDENPDEIFAEQIRQQAMIALDEACAAIMVTDGQAGLSSLDEEIARFLRQQRVPVYLCVNKCESETVGAAQAAEFWSLGLGEPFPVSGLHGYGVAELLDAVKPHLQTAEEAAAAAGGVSTGDDVVNVAIVGRPNVGKSSLLNRLFGEERAIVSDVAGTTRDTIDALFERGDTEAGTGRAYRLIDTAGVRRKKKVEYGSEFFMVNRAFKAIRRADVVLLVVDAIDGITDQDRVLAERIAEDGRACVVVCNKWDAVAEKDDKTYLKALDYVRDRLLPVRWADVVFVSAKTGQRCSRLFDLVDEAVEQHRRRVQTSVVNEVLRDAVLWQAPPARRGTQQGKIYYGNQVATRPPTMAIFCNNPKLFSDNYRRYMERKMREQLGFKSSPIRFLWRGKRLRRVVQEQRQKPKPHAN